METQRRYQGTDTPPLGSVWETGLNAGDIYRRCRVYLKPGDPGPGGLHIFVDHKTSEQFMISNGEKVYFKPRDTRPAAIYVHLGTRGGRYVIDEDKVRRLMGLAAGRRKQQTL